MALLTLRNVPLFFTLIRLIGSPIILPLLFTTFLPAHDAFINFLLATLFVLVALTDFFDGYLARRFKQVTLLGAILDPIADKFLLFSALVSLVYIHKIFYVWALIMIGREFFVVAIRQVAATYGSQLPVMPLAKMKTWLQFSYITWCIGNPYGHLSGSFGSSVWVCNGIEQLLLLAALYLTVVTAFSYYQQFMKLMKDQL